MLISENRTSAAFREVNQAARRATALSFYVPISLYISPISTSFIRLILPFFNHSISMWLIHLRDLFAGCSLCEKVSIWIPRICSRLTFRLLTVRQQLTGIPNNETSETFPSVDAMCVLKRSYIGTSDSAETLGWVWHTAVQRLSPWW